ncbi:uncharacterized protein LOC111025354 [Momordica charantia]|uniref:Uncharacterized protein LOC111025354 n=1 Tax=Momordica charantia TaxID=3673 RepID=A0A6J1E2A8_MOMCH|nr:uncharacterized protein LOC111025354 [Momordica charantia]
MSEFLNDLRGPMVEDDEDEEDFASGMPTQGFERDNSNEFEDLMKEATKELLKRLYSSKHTASEMRWHKEKRVDTEGVLRHPADAAGWKHLDTEFPHFASDLRNVRLALASDGFNPSSNMNHSYSMWSVILVPYNLPPWKCMKEPYFFMSLLIPGPKSPGKDIDVYLQPLIEELKELWTNGVRTYDCFSGEYFKMHAALLWTINDFPAYGDLSGWSTKGYQACPICKEDTSSFRIRGKISFMGHRCYLPEMHSWRRSKCHDGKIERRLPPAIMDGDEILHEVTYLKFPPFGKHPSNAKKKRKRDSRTKRSIFFELPYWSKLLLRHKVDVMHIEKNVCDSLVGTLLSIEGKSKDTSNARLDLQDLKIRKELHLQKQGNKYLKPQATYTLTRRDQIEFCKFLKSIKFPDGFVSNISRCVSVEDGRIWGLKTHDCHVLLQRILPIGIRAYVQKNVSTSIVELCKFFRDLCVKIISTSDLDRLEADIVLILCKLEKVFPPAFFDVMVHLAVHLPYEAKVVGPVSYSWMYPIERSLWTLKQYVTNKARPEGSIAKAFVMNEALTFCSLQSARPLGCPTLRRLFDDEKRIVHWQHLRMLRPWAVSATDLYRNHQLQFSDWFKSQVLELRKDGNISDDHYSLAMGPASHAPSYSGCIVNRTRFHNTERDTRRVTQNSGVMVSGDTEGDDKNFYGVLSEVLDLDLS